MEKDSAYLARSVGENLEGKLKLKRGPVRLNQKGEVSLGMEEQRDGKAIGM